ncbi:MAG: hypothetical protein ACXQTJ_04425 [Candidatus Syntropharchaeales archaeon]
MKRGSGILKVGSIFLASILILTALTPLTASASENHHRAKYLDAKRKYQQFERSDPGYGQIEETKAYIERALNYMIAYLEAVKARIEVLEEQGANPRLGSSDLQQDINELEALKVELEGCETKEEVLEVAKRARFLWIDIKGDTRYSIGFIAHHQLGSRIDQMETFSTAMDARINAIEERGEDVSDLRERLSRFNYHVESARDEYNEGVRRYERDEFRDANNHFRNAQRHLILANRILKPLVRAYMGNVG